MPFLHGVNVSGVWDRFYLRPGLRSISFRGQRDLADVTQTWDRASKFLDGVRTSTMSFSGLYSTDGSHGIAKAMDTAGDAMKYWAILFTPNGTQAGKAIVGEGIPVSVGRVASLSDAVSIDVDVQSDRGVFEADQMSYAKRINTTTFSEVVDLGTDTLDTAWVQIHPHGLTTNRTVNIQHSTNGTTFTTATSVNFTATSGAMRQTLNASTLRRYVRLAATGNISVTAFLYHEHD